MTGGQRHAEAAATIRECRRALAASGRTIVSELTGGSDVAEWQRLPEGEVYDPSSHAQYFYHCHATFGAGVDAPAEHGHFHLFLRADGVPRGVSPLVLPELAVAGAPVLPQAAPAKRGSRDEVCHLIGVALDRRGEPIRLFTTNRWVTGESWYRAEDVIAMLDCFQIEEGGGSALVNYWLGGLIRLFQPEIAGLLRERDAVIMGWRRRRRGNAFEDPRLEIPSSLEIDLDQRLAAESARRANQHAPSRLPRMAEGWGV